MPPTIDEPHITNIIRSLIYGMKTEKRDDLVQGAWLAVLEAAKVYDQHPEWGSWRNTVYRVARWSILNALKRPRLAELAGEANLPSRLDAPASARLDAETLLARLTEQDHEIILLRFHGGLTCHEIGAKIGLTGEAVRLRIKQSLKHMRY